MATNVAAASILDPEVLSLAMLRSFYGSEPSKLYRGVKKSCLSLRKWTADFELNGTRFRGLFETEEEAALVHDKAVYKLTGDPALLNFPHLLHRGSHVRWENIPYGMPSLSNSQEQGNPTEPSHTALNAAIAKLGSIESDLPILGLYYRAPQSWFYRKCNGSFCSSPTSVNKLPENAKAPSDANQHSNENHTQSGGGTNNPQIQADGKVHNEGNMNMGSFSGLTNNFNIQSNVPPQNQSAGELHNEGNMNMGSFSGLTNNFNIQSNVQVPGNYGVVPTIPFIGWLWGFWIVPLLPVFVAPLSYLLPIFPVNLPYPILPVNLPNCF